MRKPPKRPKPTPTLRILSQTERRAVGRLNALLAQALERLGAAQRIEGLPESLRSALDDLTTEVAKVQGVTEWVTERLAFLAPLAEEEPPPAPPTTTTEM